MPRIQKQRREAEAKQQRQDELYEKAQAGELNEEDEGFDWGMDV